MSVQVEKLEKNTVKLTIEVPAEELEKALQEAYNRQKKNISMPGFRKGKVPRAMVEKMYGAGVFYEDAANALIPQAYADAAKECGEDIVSRPVVDITQIEKGKPFIFTAEVATKPEVTLGKYIGVTVTKVDGTVTDEDVTAAIDKEREKNARTINVEDRAIENGDTAVIDFEGFVDGVAFDGGKGENHSLEIGSGSFIPGFEDQLIGKNAGDDVDVNAKLEEQKQNEIKRAYQDEAIDKIVDKSTMELPDAMIDTQCENMINQFAQQMAQQGLSMDQYLQFSGLTLDQLKEQVRPDAITRIKSSLVLEQIAKEENIEITDADVDAEIEKMATMYNMEADKLKEYMGEDEKENMKQDLAVQKAVELITESVKPRAKAKTKKEKEAEAETEAAE